MTEPSRWTKRDFISILVTITIILVARSSFADHYTVPSGSMEPTVAVGDRVVVHKSAYGLRLPLTSVRLTTAEMPARGDVIVLESPESGIVLLKRVVAVAGDEVTFRGAPTVVPDGKLFVMGDNRASSHDSRAFGFVDARAVLGRAVAVYFRSGELRWIAL